MVTPQHPLPSGFGAGSTAAEVLRGIALSGRLAVVTGGYSGIGLETVRALAGAGAQVIVPKSTPGAVCKAVQRQTSGSALVLMPRGREARAGGPCIQRG